MSESELKPGPELDRRVCEILGIEPDGGETFDPSDPVYPAVSSGPATIPVVMEAISRKFDEKVVIEFCHNHEHDFRFWAEVDRCDENKMHHSHAPNLALCGLAVKLGEPTTKRSEP